MSKPSKQLKPITINGGVLTPKQQAVADAIQKGIKRTALIGGIQTGKSFFLARELVKQAFSSTKPLSEIVVSISPTFLMTRVMIREVDAVLQETPALWAMMQHSNQFPATRTFPNGRVMEFHSANDPNSTRGIRPCFIGVDEGAYIQHESWKVIDGRTTQTAAPILITTTPRGRGHWLYNEVFVPAAPPSSPYYDANRYQPDRFFVQTMTIFDNPYISDDEREAKIRSYGGLHSMWARQELLGEFISFEGLVYKSFNEDVQVISPGRIQEMREQQDYEYVVGGIDFGFTDPTVITIWGLRRGVWTEIAEHYERGMTLDKLVAQCHLFKQKYGVVRYWADSEDPQKIQYLSAQAVPVMPVVKPRILTRVQYVDQLFGQGRILINSENVQTIRELTVYIWPEGADGKPDETKKPTGPDHALDSAGYVLWSEKNMLANTLPTYDDEDDGILVDRSGPSWSDLSKAQFQPLANPRSSW